MIFQDSTRIHMFLVKCPGIPPEVSSQLPTILFLHGNAGNIGHRLANVHGLVKHLQCNVCLVSYRRLSLFICAAFSENVLFVKMCYVHTCNLLS